ncbi:hypothetical protein I79_017734 [Cricetulus griseus]|uniref:Uncharacterized protein n=1 Tax=Cricetulus griseus TaxID=10029 RepID=G3I2U0_CRIGR|nr:hypothetical protein I79_017734 [Cricetulus griseus]
MQRMGEGTYWGHSLLSQAHTSLTPSHKSEGHLGPVHSRNSRGASSRGNLNFMFFPWSLRCLFYRPIP